MEREQTNEGEREMNRIDDEELDEMYCEHLEKKLPEKEMEFLRNVYDEGWDEPRQKEKMKLIVENTQGLIDKRFLK